MSVFRSLAILALLEIAACGDHAYHGSNGLKFSRESMFPDIKFEVNGVYGDKLGHAIVVGRHYSAAYAVAIDENDKVMWTYSREADAYKGGDGRLSARSEFLDVLPLSNGNILLCGFRKTKDTKTHALTTILSSTGLLVEELAALPPDTDSTSQSSFRHCFKRSPGFVLVGGVEHRTWLRFLDEDGKLVEDRVFEPLVPVGQISALADGQFVGSDYSGDSFGTSLTRFSTSGEITKSTVLTTNGAAVLQSVEPSSLVTVLQYGFKGDAAISTFDQDLKETRKFTADGHFDIRKGRGFVLPNGSIALFGHTYNVSVQYIDPLGHELQTIFDEKKAYAAPGVAANWIDGRTFICAFYSVTVDPKRNGLSLTWITMPN